MGKCGSNVSMRKYLKTTALNQARTCLKEYVLVLQKYHPDITQRIRPIGIHRSEPIVRAMRGLYTGSIKQSPLESHVHDHVIAGPSSTTLS